MLEVAVMVRIVVWEPRIQAALWKGKQRKQDGEIGTMLKDAASADSEDEGRDFKESFDDADLVKAMMAYAEQGDNVSETM